MMLSLLDRTGTIHTCATESRAFLCSSLEHQTTETKRQQQQLVTFHRNNSQKQTTATMKTTTTTNGASNHVQQHVQFKTEPPQQQQQQQQQQLQLQQQNIPVNHGLHNPPPSDPVVSVGPGQNVSAPRRGRGVLQQQQPGMRVPMCGSCNNQIRFVREWRVEDVSLLTFHRVDFN